MGRRILLTICASSVFFAAVEISSCAAAPEQPPELIARYQKVFSVLLKLGGMVWENNVPYKEVPVLAYDPGAQKEFLLNYPSSAPAGYVETPFYVNGKTAYEKKGALTIKYAGAQCCTTMGGLPVVAMGYGREASDVFILRTLLHEGFHYYQYSPTFVSGADEALDEGKKALFAGIPRDLAYDQLLVAEAKLLYGMTKEDGGQRIGAEQLKRLAAVDSLRKKRLSPEAVFGEESQLLLEGTAVYVELKGLNAILENGLDLSGTGISTGAVKAEYNLYRQHYGPEMVANQINLTTIAQGEMIYRYATGFARVLEKTGISWQNGLFPLVENSAASKEAMEKEIRKNVSGRGFSAMISKQAGFSENTAAAVWEKLQPEILSPEEIAGMDKKLKIELGMDSFPFGDGWTYKIEAGQVVYPYFDYLHGKMYIGKKATAAYLSGLAKLETHDKRVVISSISIPVVSNMFSGNIRFKEEGSNTETGTLVCADKTGDVCGRLTLEIPGLKLVAVNAIVARDSAARETTIKLR